MPNYQTPGVYIQEIDSGSKPLEAVSTSNAGFIGVIPISAFSEIRWQNAKGEDQLKRLPSGLVADDKAITVAALEKLATSEEDLVLRHNN